MVRILELLFQILGACLPLKSLIINISSVTTSLQSHINFQPLSTLIYKIQDIIKQKSNVTNIIIHKMTEIIETKTIFNVTVNKGVNNFLINSKCIAILVDSGYTFQNMPHSTSFVCFLWNQFQR